MKFVRALIFLAAVAAWAQNAVTMDPAAEAKEQAELQQAVGEAGASTVDRIRALELHLKKYPDTRQRAAIVEALAKSAMDVNDNARIVEYGEKVIRSAAPPDSNETIILLDRVIRALVDKPDVQRASRARALVRRYEADVRELRAKNEPPPGHMTAVLWSEELDKAMARALALDARATGYSGDKAAAPKLAVESWETYPSAEGAREAGYWLSENGGKAEAIEYYADAFTLEDPSSTAADRAADRKRLGELYAELNGSEKGLGEVVLAAYDRTQGLMNARRAAMKTKDPNSQATKISEFTLPAIDKSAAPLALGTLRGKTIILDFWATWCAPCRAQKPLIEELEAHYRESPDVVFVTIDADDDPSVAPAFIKEQGWKDSGYFEAGLARLLAVSSIPTVLVIDPTGRTSSRMIGFIPERFKDMLAERVEEARAVAKN
jgi:thiol-disulfide isomerase/thioredoxin